MPEVPDADDVKNEASGALADGAVYGLATGLGGSVAGGLGHAAGGVGAGASIGGQKGETLSTLAVGEGLRQLLMSGGGGGGSQRGVK